MMIDTVALDAFLSDTALLYAYDIAGAVLAISFILTLLLQFREKIMERILHD